MMKGIDDLKIELNKYLSLENNWDGYDGLPPKNGTVQDCLKFINQLEGDDFYLPKSMLSSSGNVGLYWTNKLLDLYVEVEFEGFRTFTYIVKSRKTIIGEDDCLIDSIPDNLIKYLIMEKT